MGWTMASSRTDDLGAQMDKELKVIAPTPRHISGERLPDDEC